METVEFLILRNLLYNEEYVRKVIPFIKADYFEDRNQKIVFEEIIKFVEDYNKPVTKEILCIEAEKRQDITDDSFKEITNLISNLDDDHTEFDWLVKILNLLVSLRLPKYSTSSFVRILILFKSF